MATNTEKVQELTALVQHLAFQVQAFEADIKRLSSQRDQDLKAVEDLKSAANKATTDSAVIAHRVGELEKHRESWTQRFWQLGIGLLLAVVGGVIGYQLKR